jgi:hypothetical protein
MRKSRSSVTFIRATEGSQRMHRALSNGMDHGYSATTLECEGATRSLKRRESIVPHCSCRRLGFKKLEDGNAPSGPQTLTRRILRIKAPVPPEQRRNHVC